MFSRLLLLTSFISALTPTSAQDATPAPPGLTFLYTLNCTLAPAIEVGDGPRGHRVAIPIIGGSFNGPRLSGNVSDLGADWGLTDSNSGVFTADTRYNLVTNDGVNIFISTNGPSQPDGHLHVRQTFEAGHPDYYWLNNILAIGIVTSDPTGSGAWITIDAWQVDSPATTA